MPPLADKAARLDVMLSSTTKDLLTHRAQVIAAVNRARMHHLVMEDLTASLHTPLEVSLALVEEAEIYVGIFGLRYGYRPDDARNPDGLSITELEYRRAVALGMPILIFLMDDEHPGPNLSGLTAFEMDKEKDKFFESDPIGKAKLVALKDELGRAHTAGIFNSPEALGLLVLQALTADETKAAAYAYHARRAPASPVVPAPPAPPTTTLTVPPDLLAKPAYSGMGYHFVGRRDEQDALDAWAQPDATAGAVMVVEAIGGMGKSALAWKWMQDRAVPTWARVCATPSPTSPAAIPSRSRGR